MRKMARMLLLALLFCFTSCVQIKSADELPSNEIIKIYLFNPHYPSPLLNQIVFVTLFIGLLVVLTAFSIFRIRFTEVPLGDMYLYFGNVPFFPLFGRRQLAVLNVEYSEEQKKIGEKLPVKRMITTIGRSSGNSFVFPNDNAVSRNHAIIEYQDGRFVISEVLTSKDGHLNRPKYGTYVNGVPICGNAVSLQSGDEIQLGRHLRLRFKSTVKGNTRKRKEEISTGRTG